MSSTVPQTSFLKLNNQNLQNRVSVLFNMKPKWATESINSPANLSGLRDIFPYTPIEYSHSQTALNTIWQPAASSGCRRLMAVAVKIGKQACDPVQSPVTGKSVFPRWQNPHSFFGCYCSHSLNGSERLFSKNLFWNFWLHSWSKTFTVKDKPLPFPVFVIPFQVVPLLG